MKAATVFGIEEQPLLICCAVLLRLHSGSWERSFLSLQGLGKQDFFLIKLIDSQLLLFMVGQMGSSILYFSPFSGLVSTTQERWPSCLMLREPNMFLKFLYFFNQSKLLFSLSPLYLTILLRSFNIVRTPSSYSWKVYSHSCFFLSKLCTQWVVISTASCGTSLSTGVGDKGPHLPHRP